MATQQKNGPVATISNVSIRTLSVNIKVIQMNEKQTTLAKFKQFHEGTLINELDLTLNGMVWGYVNYYWDYMDRKCRHFLFEVDGALYRDLVYLRPSEDFANCRNNDLPSGYEKIKESIDITMGRIYAHRLIEGYLPPFRKDCPYLRDWAWYWKVDGTFLKGFVRPGTSSFDISDNSLSDLQHDNTLPHSSSNREFAIKKLRKIRDRDGQPCDSKELTKELNRYIAEIKDYCRRWDDLMVQLREAQHLFIAV